MLAGRPPEEDEIEPLSRAVLELARDAAVDGLPRPRSPSCSCSRAATVAFFADYDLLLTPVLAARPLPIGELHGCGEEPLDDLLPLRRASRPTRRCSTSRASRRSRVPVGFGEDGLPTAVQLVGHPLGEETLLQVAAQLETARPWAAHRPGDRRARSSEPAERLRRDAERARRPRCRAAWSAAAVARAASSQVSSAAGPASAS